MHRRLSHAGFFRATALTVFLACASAPAAPVDADTARSAGETWLALSGEGMAASLAKQTGALKKYTLPDGGTCFVLPLWPTGFVVLAGDDSVEPVLAFAAGGAFVEDTASPLYALLSRDLPERLRHANKTAAPAAAWERLRAGAKGEDLISEVWIAPLVESQWSQSTANGLACYNYYTPPGPDGSPDNYLAGCVATAMAQVLRFHSYPVAGVGTGAHEIFVNGVPETRNLRGGDGLGGPYDWANMPLDPRASDATLAERQAIGALLHDAALSVNMQFTYQASGAIPAGGPFRAVFQYDSAVIAEDSWVVTDANLKAMINPNLVAGYPVMLTINSDESSHAIVCDGYGRHLGAYYHHLNLGWGGNKDAWYNLPLVNVATHPYNIIAGVIYNIYPDGTGEMVGGRVTNAGGTAIDGATITITAPGLSRQTTTNVNGLYAFAQLPPDTTYTLDAEKLGHTLVPLGQPAQTGHSEEGAPESGNRWDVDFTESTGAPLIGAAPAEVAFTAALGGSAPDTVLEVWNADIGTLAYTLSEDVAWLTSPASGTSTGEHDAITLETDIAGLDFGIYETTLTIDATGIANAPYTVAVKLNLNPPLAQALDTQDLVWECAGDEAWFGQVAENSDGLHAGQSGPTANLASSALSTTLSGPLRLGFHWKVSSEAGFDYLRFVLDGEQQAAISGETEWAEVILEIPPGTHTVQWTYTKDPYVRMGTDCGWVDQVAVMPCGACTPSSSTYFEVGQDACLRVPPALAQDATQFAWSKQGQGPLEEGRYTGTACGTLFIPELTYADTGTYRCEYGPAKSLYAVSIAVADTVPLGGSLIALLALGMAGAALCAKRQRH